MGKVYIPSDINTDCLVLIKEGVIRSYNINNTIIPLDINISYIDIYYKSDYITIIGTTIYTYYNLPPTCNNITQEITNEIWYRYDFTNILIIFTVFTIFTVFIPIKIFSKLFKRGAL